MEGHPVKKVLIPQIKRMECLECFQAGFGYKKTASVTGLNIYTVRDYLRRYKAGDTDWAYRGGNPEDRVFDFFGTPI